MNLQQRIGAYGTSVFDVISPLSISAALLLGVGLTIAFPFFRDPVKTQSWLTETMLKPSGNLVYTNGTEEPLTVSNQTNRDICVVMLDRKTWIIRECHERGRLREDEAMMLPGSVLEVER